MMVPRPCANFLLHMLTGRLVRFYSLLWIIPDNQSPRINLALLALNMSANICKIGLAPDKTRSRTKESFNRNQHGEEENETRENLAKAPYVFRIISNRFLAFSSTPHN